MIESGKYRSSVCLNFVKTRKHSSRMRTDRGSGLHSSLGDRLYLPDPYPPDTLSPQIPYFPWIPYPLHTLPIRYPKPCMPYAWIPYPWIPYLLDTSRYPTPWNGPGTRNTPEKTWDQWPGRNLEPETPYPLWTGRHCENITFPLRSVTRNWPFGVEKWCLHVSVTKLC